MTGESCPIYNRNRYLSKKMKRNKWGIYKAGLGIPVLMTCSMCNEIRKVPEEFYEDQRGKYGVTRRCRRCHVDSSYESRKKNQNHSWVASIRKLGIFPRHYDEMLDAQNGVCAICGSGQKAKTHETFDVDHCHTTGKVRGLLCGPCNRGLGQFMDNPENLRKASEYLEKTKDGSPILRYWYFPDE